MVRSTSGDLKDDLQNKLDTALWLHLYVPKEESFPIPLKYIDVTRTTHTNLDALQEKRINGYWNVEKDRTWPDSWTGFTRFTLLNEKISRMYVVWRATYTNSSNYQTWLFVAWDFELAFQKQLKRKKKNWLWRKQSSTTFEGWEASIFIDQEDEEQKETIQNARN